ncbi:hypothetical protein BgiMline_026481, partial [Biomphalaria glabrata]
LDLSPFVCRYFTILWESIALQFDLPVFTHGQCAFRVPSQRHDVDRAQTVTPFNPLHSFFVASLYLEIDRE